MALKDYHKKRKFDETSEPKGKTKKSKDKLIFVIQRHAASRLHYDFRLEMEGVLKSWAVPKGPSLDPKDKRLAMMVEDHPYDYKDFEGNIPEGNYGAGQVEVWDSGTYEPLEENTKLSDEKELLKELHAGSLKFILHGKKLKGEFALVKMKNTDDNSWLLIKHKDDFAESPYDAEEKTSSQSLVTKFLEEKKSLKIKEKKKS
ncbi:DNA polymerase ligase N-terminal domain-containing protein [Chryseobacterium sp.]|jgi:bifunctional non-homologous end joining protein LigD|uniref:DNA polymerase ligase N-terminal domain-containing protein n=1 Tax=Chryseobacterium sp. TaxID=1871047 RepID=UPI00284D6DB5|nr:DNA polymerase ligase N-terminal domain-containing protein [Chryseobacterium sp.]MDR3025641.1 3'-phosphoesterase [Chryseobacterium sp.]